MENVGAVQDATHHAFVTKRSTLDEDDDSLASTSNAADSLAAASSYTGSINGNHRGSGPGKPSKINMKSLFFALSKEPEVTRRIREMQDELNRDDFGDAFVFSSHTPTETGGENEEVINKSVAPSPSKPSGLLSSSVNGGSGGGGGGGMDGVVGVGRENEEEVINKSVAPSPSKPSGLLSSVNGGSGGGGGGGMDGVVGLSGENEEEVINKSVAPSPSKPSGLLSSSVNGGSGGGGGGGMDGGGDGGSGMFVECSQCCSGSGKKEGHTGSHKVHIDSTHKGRMNVPGVDLKDHRVMLSDKGIVDDSNDFAEEFWRLYGIHVEELWRYFHSDPRRRAVTVVSINNIVTKCQDWVYRELNVLNAPKAHAFAWAVVRLLEKYFHIEIGSKRTTIPESSKFYGTGTSYVYGGFDSFTVRIGELTSSVHKMYEMFA